MRNKSTLAALLTGMLLLPNYATLARDAGVADVLPVDGFQAGGSREATCASRRIGARDWVCLHRPDGEIIHIRIDQIVYVTSAAPGAAKRARSKIQLLNGFTDVRESIEEVMRAIQTDPSKQISNM